MTLANLKHPSEPIEIVLTMSRTIEAAGVCRRLGMASLPVRWPCFSLVIAFVSPHHPRP